MNLMKKLFLVLSLAAFSALFAWTVPLTGAFAGDSDSFDSLMAAVTLLDMEVDEEGLAMVMTLQLTSGEIEVEVSRTCDFLDGEGNGLTPSDFLDRYRGSTITVEFLQISPGLEIVYSAWGSR